MQPTNVALLDVPVESVDADDLQRHRHAVSLAALIHHMPPGSSVRIGVYGDWGEGKTSVMKMMAAELRSRGHCSVFFAPWAARTQDEAWDLLLANIGHATKTFQLGYRAAAAGRKKVGPLLKLAALIPGVPDVGDAVAQPVTEMIGSLNAWQRQRILRKVKRRLGSQKLVVFVDDLDRTPPPVVPGLLMSLRELFSLPNFYYVLGLSPSVISEGLEQSGYRGMGQADRFLEKIVEYPTYLPPVTSSDVSQMTRRAVNEAPEAFNLDALDRVAILLPRNPRRLKLFLRHIAGIRELTSRFSPDELDWTAFYTAQILRMEFPRPTKDLANDPEAISSIEMREFREASQKKGDQVAETLPEERHAPDSSIDPNGNARFRALCAALANRGWLRGRYELTQLLTLFDDPPLLTWSESFELRDRLSSLSPQDRVAGLRTWLVPPGSSEPIPSRAEALFIRMVELRDLYLDHAVEAHSPEEIRAHVRDALGVSQLIRAMIEELRLFSAGMLTATSWLSLYDHISKWARFHRDPVYGSAREDERVLLRASLVGLPAETAVGIVESRPAADASDRNIGGESEQFLEDAAAANSTVSTLTAEYLVEGFASPERLATYWGVDWNWKAKSLLFDPESRFHEPDMRHRLRAIASRAESDESIHENFFTYLRMLCYGAFDFAGSFSPTGCEELLKDSDLLGIVWAAAVARPFNWRSAGSLRDNRDKILGMGVSASVVPLPPWWQPLEETFFARRDRKAT